MMEHSESKTSTSSPSVDKIKTVETGEMPKATTTPSSLFFYTKTNTTGTTEDDDESAGCNDHDDDYQADNDDDELLSINAANGSGSGSSKDDDDNDDRRDRDRDDNLVEERSYYDNNDSMRVRGAVMISEYSSSVAEDTTFDFDDTTTDFTTTKARLLLRQQQQQGISSTHDRIDTIVDDDEEEEEEESSTEEEEEDNTQDIQTVTSFFTSNPGGGDGSGIQPEQEQQEQQQQQEEDNGPQQQEQEEWTELLVEQEVNQTESLSSSSSWEEQQDETMSLNTIGSDQIVERKLKLSKDKIMSAQQLLQQTHHTQKQQQKKKSGSSIRMMIESITACIKPLLEIFTIIGVGWMLWPEFIHRWNNNYKNSNDSTNNDQTTENNDDVNMNPSYQPIQRRGGYEQQQNHQQMKSVLDEKEDLLKEIRKLQSEIEWKNTFRRDVVDPSSPIMKGGGYSSSQQQLLNSVSSFTKTTAKTICNEVDLIGSCWSILIFGTCIITSRLRKKRIATRKCFPIHRTAVTTEKIVKETILPLLKDHTAPDSIIGNVFQCIQRSIEANAGSVRDFVGKIVTSVYGLFQTVILEMILPILVESTKQSIRYVRIFVLAVMAPSSTSQAVETAVTTLPKDVIIAELKHQIKHLTEDLRTEEYEHDSLKENMVCIEGTMKGQNCLLYEERMKGRSWRLQYNQIKQELELYQENRKKINDEIRNEATVSTAIENQRLLHEFLNEHIRRRILETHNDVHGNGATMAVTATASSDTLACTTTMMNGGNNNNGNNDKYAILPEPILQSFSRNLYKNHILSNVSSDCSSLTKDTGPPRCGGSGDDIDIELRDGEDVVGVDACRNRGGIFDGECRDDSVGTDGVESNTKDDDKHDYFSDQLKEQILNNYNNNNNNNNNDKTNNDDAVIRERFIAQSRNNKSAMMWPQPSSSLASRFASNHANRHSFMAAAMPTLWNHQHQHLSPFLMAAATTTAGTTNSNVTSKNNNNSSHIHESGSSTNLMVLPFECCRGQEEEIRE
jgi:hypothetical protein